MTDKTSETLAKLKSALLLSDVASPDLLVSLANIGASNVDWNPMEHPRNQLGHFVKKGQGVFLLGQNKKGKFKGPAANDVQVDYDLEPGDIAYSSPMGNLLVKHADGSWDNHTTLGGKKTFSAQSAEAYVYNKKIDKGSFSKVDEAPATEIQADSLEVAQKALETKVTIGDTVDKTQMALLPEGAVVTGGKVQLTKNKDGHWISEDGDDMGVWAASPMTVVSLGTKAKGTPENDAEAIDKENPSPASLKPSEGKVAAVEAQLETPSAPAVPDSPKKTAENDLVGKDVSSVGELEAAPVGTQMNLKTENADEIYVKTAEGWVYQKKDSEPDNYETPNDSEDFSYIIQDSGIELKFLSFPDKPAKDDAAGAFVGESISSLGMLKKLPEGTMIEYVDNYMGYGDSYVKKGDLWQSPDTPSMKMSIDQFLFDSDHDITVKSLPVTEEKTPDKPVFNMNDPWSVPPKSDSSLPKSDSSSTGIEKNPGDSLNTEEEIESLPVGSFVSSKNPNLSSFELQKSGDNTWVNPDFVHTDGPTLTSSQLSEAAFGLQLQVKSVGDGSVGHHNTLSHFKNAKTGDSLVTKGGTVWTKTSDDAWVSDEGETVTSASMISFAKNGASFTLQEKSKVAAEKPSEKAPTVTPVANPGGKNKLTSNDPNDAPDGLTSMTPVTWGGGDSVHLIHNLFTSEGFNHPVSKETFALEKGDSLLQHKLTPEKFAVLGADGTKKYEINKLGKKYKWGNHIPKSNFKVVMTATKDYGTVSTPSVPDVNQYLKGNKFTHPESGLEVSIGADEVLMQHNFTPHSYLVMDKSGNMLYKIDVKGKKQKAGTNLKPSNYFVAKEGKAPKNVLESLKENPNWNLFGSFEVHSALDGADPGDFFDFTTHGVSVKLVKEEDGGWTDDTQTPWSIFAAAKFLTPEAPAGTKSEFGVPLNPKEMTDWMDSLTEGSTVTFPEAADSSPLTFTKDSGGSFKVSDGTTVSAPIAIQKIRLKSESASKLKASFVLAPKKKNNDNGVPVFGDADEIKSFLESQPVGASYKNVVGDSVTKDSSGNWKSSSPYSTPSNSSVVANALSLLEYKFKNDLKFYPPVKSAPVKEYSDVNAHGVPLGSFAEAQSYLDSFPEGSEFTWSSGSVFTKKGDGNWWQSNGYTKHSSSKLANLMPSYKGGSSENTFKVISAQEKLDAISKLKQKLEAAKSVKPNSSGAATTKFASEQEVLSYVAIPESYTDIDYSDSSLFTTLYKIISDQPELKHFGGQSNPYESLQKGYGYESKFNSLAEHPEISDYIQVILDNLGEAKKTKGLLSPSSKAKITKTIAKFEQWKKIIEVGTSLANGELVDLPDEDFTWGLYKTWPFDLTGFYPALSAKHKELSFKAEQKDLGWEPLGGTEEQYTDWLLKNGHAGGQFLSPDEKKNLALHHMGSPLHQISAHALSKYQSKMMKGKFLAEASESLKKKNGAPFVPAQAPDKEFPGKPTTGFASQGTYALTDDQWKLVQFSLSTDNPQDLSTLPLPNWFEGAEESSPLKFLPPDAAKALLQVGTSQEIHPQVMKSVAIHLLQSGLFYTDHLVYDGPHGKIAVAPGTSVWKNQDGYLVFIPKDEKFEEYKYFFSVNAAGDWDNFSSSSSPENWYGNWTKEWTAPYKITLSDAAGDGHKFDAKEWADLEAAEGFTKPKSDFSGNESVKLKSSLKNVSASISSLTNKAKTLIIQNPEWADMIAYKDIKGHYRVMSSPESQWSDFVKSSKISGLPEIKDHTSPKFVTPAILSLSIHDRESLGKELGLTRLDDETDVDFTIRLRNAITAFGDQNEDGSTSTPDVGVAGVLKPITGFNLGGGQPKAYFSDYNGDKYFGKINSEKKFRPDSEHAANSIFSMFGFTTPPSTVREIDGQYQVVFKVLDTSGDLDGVSLTDMSESQLLAAMSSHPMDWAVSNHDTHGGNFLVAPDGETLISIDKGQAWKALGSDKLQVGWELPGNFGGVWYNKFYEGVASKKISKETLDKVAQAALKKARQISTKYDDDYRAQLEFAFKNRTSFPKGTTKDSFIEAAMKRKHDTFTDFLTFYEGVYKSGGHKFEWKPEDFESTVLEGSDAHLALSQDLMDEVASFGSFGKSLMVAGDQVEDAHVLLYATKTADGKQKIGHGDMIVRKNGDDAIMEFLKANGVNASTVATAPPTEPKATQGIPDTTNAWSNLVNFAKTVSHHQADGEYNQQHVSSADSSLKTLKSQVGQLQVFLKDDPLYVGKGSGGIPNFQTGHQQQAWLSWASDMITKIEATQAAMAAKEKSPKWSQEEPVYTPPKGIDISGKPKVIETLETSDGKKYTKYSDWNYVGPDGALNQTEYEALQSQVGSKTVSDVATPTPVKSEVVAPKKPIQIKEVSFSLFKTKTKKHPETGKNVSDIDEFGFVKEDGKDNQGQSSGEAGSGGYVTYLNKAYEITSKDHPGVTVQYNPYATGDPTNRGRIQFSIDNFDGSVAQMESAINLVKAMGVSMDDATDEDMELFYWKHLYGVLKDRKAGHKGKDKKTLDKINAAYDAGGMSKSQELAMLKEAWSENMGKDIVDSADWRPQFDQNRAGATGYEGGQTDGRPYWMRPDYDPEAYKKWVNGQLPGRDFWNSTDDGYSSAERPYSGGGFLSNEERTRFTGAFAKGDGASGGNTGSSDRGVGGSKMIFTRLKKETGGTNHQYFEPAVFGRTTSWSATGDAFGSMFKKNTQAPFNLEEVTTHGSFEFDIKYGVSAWDNLAATIVSPTVRKKMMEYFAKKGITEIRGIPVSERIVDNQADLKKTLDKVWAAAIKAHKEKKK